MDANVIRRLTAQSDIDAEIVKYEDVVRKLRTRRNELTKICQLPVETLLAIFELVADDASYTGVQDSGWIHITAICSQWRDAALACPSLWSRFQSNENPQWVAEKLRRSKAAPLRLHYFDASYSFAFKRTTEILDVVLKHSERIRELAVESNATILTTALQSLSQKSNILRSLRLVSKSDPHYELPTQFLSCEKQYLRSLELVNVKVPWDAPFFSQLTELEIKSFSVDSMKPILSALQNMPRLTALTLETFLQKPHSDHFAANDIQPAEKILLPNLTRLAIRQTHFDGLPAIHLLSLISCPILSSLKFHYNGLQSKNFAGLEPLIEPCRRVLANVPDADAQCAEVYTESAYFTLCLHHMNAYVFPELSRTDKPLAIDLRIDWAPVPYWQESAGEILATMRGHAVTFLSSLPLESIKSLKFIQSLVVTALTKKQWGKAFGTLRQLEELTVNRSDGVLEVLQTNEIHDAQNCSAPTSNALGSSDKQTGKPSLHFPHLRRLIIDGWSFDYKISKKGETLQDKLFKKLLRCLLIRLKRGHKLKQLEIIDCRHLTDSAIEKLKMKVKGLEVEWDGYENFTDEDEDEYDSEDYDEEGYYSDDPYFGYSW